MIQQQCKICLEIAFEDEKVLSELSIGSSTEVLGGKVSRVDFEGCTFNSLDWFFSLFNDEQMSFLCNRPHTDERIRSAIWKALDKLIDEIKDEELLDDDNDIPY